VNENLKNELLFLKKAKKKISIFANIVQVWVLFMKNYCITVYLCIFYFVSMGQGKTVDFITQHQKYIVLAEKIREQIETPTQKFTFLLTIYGQDNVTIEWKPTSSESSTVVNFHFSERFSIFEFSCSKSIEENQQKSLKNFVQQLLENPAPSNSSILKKYLNKTTISYLQKANTFAQKGYHCDSGDDYQANLYSEIILTDTYMQLNQSNWWNAKSLERDNYCMRKLFFLIPIQGNNETTMQKLKNDYTNMYVFQEMLAGFEDTSSANRRTCGQAILAALKKEFE